MEVRTRFEAIVSDVPVAGGAITLEPGGPAVMVSAEDAELLRSLGSGAAPEFDDADAARTWTARLARLVEAGLVRPRPDSEEPPPSARPAVRPERQALRDPLLDKRLRTEGYVKVRLLSAEQATELRLAYGELHGWKGEGFEPDPGNPDREYRTRSREILGAVLDPKLSELFLDHSPFLQGFYCKWPDTPETHLHADWTSVNEHLGHRSYIAWTALQDIFEDSGQMAVLPGSHAVDSAPRGSNLNLPLTSAWVGEEERIWQQMVRVPLKAGEALVFDMGLIHASFTNSTDLPRVAGVTCLRPDEAELVYYRGVGDDAAFKYLIDEEFFLEKTPAALVDELPGRTPGAVIDVTPSPAARTLAHQVLTGESRLTRAPLGSFLRRRFRGRNPE
jgi:hypothetical protein